MSQPNAELLAAMKEVLRISDRKHDAWDRAYAAIAAAESAAPAAPGDEAVEAALKATWEMVDPLHPPGAPGSFWRGNHNGICAALKTFRANYDRELRARPVAPPPATFVDALEDVAADHAEQAFQAGLSEGRKGAAPVASQVQAEALTLRGQNQVLASLLRDALGPLEVSIDIIEGDDCEQDDVESMRDLLGRIRKALADLEPRP